MTVHIKTVAENSDINLIEIGFWQYWQLSCISKRNVRRRNEETATIKTFKMNEFLSRVIHIMYINVSQSQYL